MDLNTSGNGKQMSVFFSLFCIGISDYAIVLIGLLFMSNLTEGPHYVLQPYQ